MVRGGGGGEVHEFVKRPENLLLFLLTHSHVHRPDMKEDVRLLESRRTLPSAHFPPKESLLIRST